MSGTARGRGEPHVCVITPVFNGAKHIGACIASVRAQTYTNWSHVVVDNCSTDATARLVLAEAAHDARLRYVRAERHRPIIENWNAALRELDPHSRYCKVLHADDEMFPECLARMVDTAETYPQAGIVGAYVLQDRSVMCDGLPRPHACFSGPELAAATLRGEVYVFGTPSSLLLRAEVVRAQTPFYDPRYLHADAAACLRVLQDWDFAHVHQVLTYTRMHDESVTATVCKAGNTRTLEWLLMLEEFGERFLNAQEMRCARRHLEASYYRALAQVWSRGGEARQRRALEARRLAAWGSTYRPRKFIAALAKFRVERLLKLALRRVTPGRAPRYAQRPMEGSDAVRAPEPAAQERPSLGR